MSAMKAFMLVALVSLCWGLLPVLAAEQAPARSDPNAPAAKPSEPAAGSRTFTNKDLAPYKSKVPPARIVVDTTALGKKDEAPDQQAISQEEKERRMAELRKSIVETEEKIALVDKKTLSAVNPFAPRPPTLTEQERETRRELGAQGWHENLLSEKENLQKKLADLQSQLAAVVAAPVAPGKEPGVAGAASPPAPPQPQPSPRP